MGIYHIRIRGSGVPTSLQQHNTIVPCSLPVKNGNIPDLHSTPDSTHAVFELIEIKTGEMMLCGF